MTSPHKQNHSQPSAKSLKAGQAKPYKSPPRKLVSFFEKSRDQWKAKCLDAKARVKRHRNRLRFLATSKERWKHRVTVLTVELAQLKAQVRARDKEIADLKKNALRKHQE